MFHSSRNARWIDDDFNFAVKKPIATETRAQDKFCVLDWTYLFFTLRRYFALSLIASLALLCAFVAFSYAEIAIVPRGTLNGSRSGLCRRSGADLVSFLALHRRR